MTHDGHTEDRVKRVRWAVIGGCRLVEMHPAVGSLLKPRPGFRDTVGVDVDRRDLGIGKIVAQGKGLFTR